MDAKAKFLIDQVHRHDELLAERKRLTADIDAEIERIEEALALAHVSIPTEPTPQVDRVFHIRIPLEKEPAVGVTAKKGSNAEKILRLYERNPAITFSEVLADVYGEDTKQNRHNLRSVLWNLRKTDRLPDSAIREANAA